MPPLVAHRLGLHLLCPLLTSERASRHLSMAGSPLGHHTQISPGITHPLSRLCPSDLRHRVPCKFWASEISDSLPPCGASYPLPVRRTSALPSGFLQTRGRPRSPCHWLTLPLAGRVEVFHLLVDASCRTHRKKRALSRPLLLVFPWRQSGGSHSCSGPRSMPAGAYQVLASLSQQAPAARARSRSANATAASG